MFRWLFRISSYLVKELMELLRQPRLIFGLILAPFLILLLVGLGYQNEPRTYRTLFVAPENSQIREFIGTEAEQFSSRLIFEGFAEDLETGIQRLQGGEVDLVITVENNPRQQVEEGERAWLIFYHDIIDPQQAGYMPVFARVIAEEVNQQVVTRLLRQEQVETQSVTQTLDTAVKSAEVMEQALEASDPETAAEEKARLQQSLSTLDLLLLALQPLGGEEGDSEQVTEAEVARLLEQVEELNVESTEQDQEEQLEQVRDIKSELKGFENRLETFQSIPPELLVSPFRGGASNVAEIEPTMTDYYVGPVIALMLQHLAVTFASLSYVRDRQLGVTELVRVAPIKAFELMLGKYLSHFLASGLIAAVLTVLAVTVLGTPMLGYWVNLVIITAALLFISIGMGFVISLLSETDSQAVQYSMILLLASVFLSGFFLPLENLWWPVRSIAWLLPSTYGILMFRDVMLRGLVPSALTLSAVVGMGLIYFLLTLVLLRRFLQPAEEI
jgi:ABC-2 type transport system permease protein